MHGDVKVFMSGTLLVGFVYLLIGIQPLLYLDRMFLPDDTYYTLSIARSIAQGLGPSTDGVIQTSGFQPLVAFFMVPVFWLSEDPDTAVAVSVMLSGVFGVASVLLAGLVVAQSTGSARAGFLTTLFAGTAPVLVANGLNGLETSMAAAFALLAVLVLERAGSKPTVPALIGIGIAAGFAMLARIDNAFVIFLVGLLSLWRLGIWRTAVIVFAAVAVVSPWWLYSLVEFGGIIPESGEAVRQIILYYQEARLPFERAVRLGFKALSLVGLEKAGPGWPVFAGLAVLVLVLAVRRGFDGPAVLALAAVSTVVFYVLYLPAFWFFDRYFNLVYLSIIVAAAVVAVRFSGTSPGRLRAVAAGAVVLCFANVVQLTTYLSRPEHTLYGNERSPRGYAEVARGLLPELPDGAVLTAMQSGALTYYADRGIRVVNLDGVVNSDAKDAIRDERLLAYLREIDADYFSDWEGNAEMLKRFSGAADPEFLTEVPLPTPLHLGEFLLYRIEPGDN